MDKRLAKRHKRQVERAKEKVKLSEPDVRTPEQIEAARLDGCSTVQIHTRIILPMLRPVLGVAILFRATEAVREFDKVYILTGGGPGSSTTVNDLFQYRISFTNFDLSYGAALGLVTFVAMLIVTALTFRTITRSAVSS